MDRSRIDSEIDAIATLIDAARRQVEQSAAVDLHPLGERVHALFTGIEADPPTDPAVREAVAGRLATLLADLDRLEAGMTSALDDAGNLAGGEEPDPARAARAYHGRDEDGN